MHKSINVGVGGIKPKLIKRIRRRFRWIQPDSTAFAFAKLRAVSLGNERHRKTIDLILMHAPSEIDAAGDIAPLVAASDLQGATIALV